MAEKTDLALLLDYYGEFLTPRQRELMLMSVDEDMSLREISEEIGVSRQGVRDCLSKASLMLCEMEDKLGLASRDKKLRIIAETLLGAASGAEGDIADACAKAGEEILSVIK